MIPLTAAVLPAATLGMVATRLPLIDSGGALRADDQADLGQVGGRGVGLRRDRAELILNDFTRPLASLRAPTSSTRSTVVGGQRDSLRDIREGGLTAVGPFDADVDQQELVVGVDGDIQRAFAVVNEVTDLVASERGQAVGVIHKVNEAVRRMGLLARRR